MCSVFIVMNDFFPQLIVVTMFCFLITEKGGKEGKDDKKDKKDKDKDKDKDKNSK